MKHEHVESEIFTNNEERQHVTCLQNWARASGAKADCLEKSYELLRTVPSLPREPIEAAKVLRLHLIKNGFNYSEEVFTLQDVLDKKQANCLGYSLLYAFMLSERGFKPEFKILTHPYDAVDEQDKRLFKELSAGEYFPYDRPKLPKLSEKAQHPINRFTPLNHPILILEGKPFEPTTTDKEAIDEDPVYLPRAEAESGISIFELASFVYIDRAKQLFRSFKGTGRGNLAACKALAEEGLKQWNGNRDGWGLMWELGGAMGDKKLQRQSFLEYEKFVGNDSGSFYIMYYMTGRQEYLERSLEIFPENIPAFLDKNVFLEKNEKEARFNLAVGMWCVCNSVALKLEDYYTDEKYLGAIRKFYGGNVAAGLFQKKLKKD